MFLGEKFKYHPGGSTEFSTLYTSKCGILEHISAPICIRRSELLKARTQVNPLQNSFRFDTQVSAGARLYRSVSLIAVIICSSQKVQHI